MDLPDLIMLDLETLDTIPTAKILQIGAVNILKPHLDFCCTVNRYTQQDYFTTESEDTIAFWNSQPKEIRDEVFTGKCSIQEALQLLTSWVPKNAKIFCYGAAFDHAILSYHYAMLDLPAPWAYRDLRCFRTTWEQFKNKSPTDWAPFEKVPPVKPHNALYDAHAQAASFRQIYEFFPEIAE